MEFSLLMAVDVLSLTVGLIGITIIFVGAVKAFLSYLLNRKQDFQSIRLTLGSHTILGLDFLVGKDIIDTLLIDHNGEFFWRDLTLLITVVIIRIVLTHFMLKEIRELKIKN